MNEEAPTTEDLTILAALEDWIDAPPGTRQDETTETLSRLYIEVLGLIPYELAAVPPSAGAKDLRVTFTTPDASPNNIIDYFLVEPNGLDGYYDRHAQAYSFYAFYSVGIKYTFIIRGTYGKSYNKFD